jgi:allantoinase
MSTIDQVFLSTRVVAADGVRPAAVLVSGGVIVDVVLPHERPMHVPVVDVIDAVLMPGLVDTHVHVNEPGRTTWEGFLSATEAAARGGITTLVDMPLNSLPPTTTLAHFEDKLDAARGQMAIDVGFWGGVVPGNCDDAKELTSMVKRGVRGFKCFLIDSGVPEFGFVVRKQLQKAMPVLKDLDVPLLTHAELQGPCDDVAGDIASIDPRSYRAHVESRPKASEDEAVRMVLALARETGTRVHVVHHSSSTSLDDFRRAKHDGVRVTVETCPHYLTFNAEDIADGATHFKCTPPIRERANNELLWDAVREGLIDAVVSDHSPCTAALKQLDIGDFARAWGGIAGLQASLPAFWTGLWRRNGAASLSSSLLELVQRMSTSPARLASLPRKGAIAAGKDADLVAFDPEAAFVVDGDRLAHKNKITPYHGLSLQGVVRATWLRGQRVILRGDGRCSRHGRALLS